MRRGVASTANDARGKMSDGNMPTRQHWEDVYLRKQPTEVSWYRTHLDVSIRFIDGAGLARDAAIIDVGGGASTLVDDLLARGYTDVTVLDVAPQALDAARARLGPAAAANVRWLAADVTQADLSPSRYALWHDRAVFHFLRDEAERRRYRDLLRRALQPGGHVVMGTFGPEGPERCSGLEVARYDAGRLHAELGPDFELVGDATEVHQTPWGAPQQFVYAHLRFRPTGT
jgi:SAM-dependent methyltransferase